MYRWKFLPPTLALGLVLAACTGAPGGSPSPDETGPAETGGATGAPETTAPDGEQGGTLVFMGPRAFANIDPALVSDGESFRVLQQAYEPLIDLVPGTVDELEGVLAESWEGGPEDTEYVFHLREGITFHDGTPFNAEAVKYNFDRWQNLPEELQGSAYYYDAVMNGFGEGNLIESVEATDEYTVTITLTQPSATFLYGIALTPFSIASPTVLEEVGADEPEAPFATEVTQAGTGPFMLEDYVPGESVTLVRNDNYWGEPAYLDRVIIRPQPDSAARLQALQGGSVQGFDLVNPSDYETVREDFSLVERLSFNTLYLGLNPVARENAAPGTPNERDFYDGETESPLQDLAVRQAIAHAIDREALIETFYAGLGDVAHTFIPPTSQWHDAVAEGVEEVEYSQDEARRLLEEAGFGPENPPTIHFWYPTEVVRPYMYDPAGLHQAVTTMLEDVGFTVVPHNDIWDDPGYLYDAQNGLYDLHFLGWTGDYDDPGNFYGVHFGYNAEGEPASQFGCDPEGLDEAIQEADQVVEPEARGEAWAEVAGLVHGEVCFVTLVHATSALGFAPEVNGFVANPTGSESFARTWLEGGGR